MLTLRRCNAECVTILYVHFQVSACMNHSAGAKKKLGIV